MIWNEAYPKSEFKYPWKIAEFISAGKRPEGVEKVDAELQPVINAAWCHEPKDRADIDTLIEKLEDILEKITINE